MKVAVVILNWNGRELLKEFLPSVVKFSPEANIYVADNASSDDSVEFVSEHFPEIEIIQNKVNGGFAKGYNDALALLNEDVFVLLNSDVEVTKNWLKPLIIHLKENPKTAVVQPKIMDYFRKEYFEYSGAAGGFLDKLGYPFCRGRIFDTLEKDEGQYDEVCNILWASGACLVIRREVFNEVGGMDETYFAHQEEIDLCWRIHNLGYDLKFIPDSKVYHMGGATLNKMNPQKTYLNFRNSLFNLLKNSSAKGLYFLIFSRLVLDGAAGIKFLLEGKFKHTLAIIRAHFGFYKRFFKIKQKRNLQTSRKKYAAVKSIVWQYYILRKRSFNELKFKRK